MGKFAGLVYSIIGLLFCMAAGCSSSQKNTGRQDTDIPNLVSLQPPPEDVEHVESTVYIDSVRRITRDQSLVLLIQGDFPDGCTSIGRIEFKQTDESAEISLYVWRNPNRICTQALVPFSYIYSDIKPDLLQSLDSININGQTFTLE